MTYRGYSITRGEVITLDDGRRKGTYDIGDPAGNVVDFVSYSLGNHLACTYALTQAKLKIDRILS